MAVLNSSQVIFQYGESGPDLFGVFWLRNVSTGDTIDVSAYQVFNSGGAFQEVKQAAVLSPAEQIANVAAFTGTVITIPAGFTKSSGYLLVTGC